MDREKCKQCAEKTHDKKGFLKCSLGKYPANCASFREHDTPLAEVEKIRREVAKRDTREKEGAINIYECGKCGTKTIAVLLEAGVTPFMIKCAQCNNGHAHSKMYPAKLQNTTGSNAWLAVLANLVWFRPETKEEAVNQKQWGDREACLEHWRNGGLFKWSPTPGDIERIKKDWERRFHNISILDLANDARKYKPLPSRFA